MRRLLALLLGTVLVAGGVFALLLVFNARDDAGLGGQGAAAGPGDLQPNLGSRHVAAGRPVPRQSLSEPPSSGAHHDRLPTREGRLSTDEILHALELGDVIIFYDAERPPAALRALQRDVSGPFDPEVAAAGQQVILARRDGAGRAGTVTAAAWRRLLHTDDPSDPRLREFAEAWIGRGVRG